MGRAWKTGVQLGLLLIAAATGTAWTYFYLPTRPALYLAPEIDHTVGITLDEILAWQTPPVWIDARSDEAYRLDHVPTAISMNSGNVDSQLRTHFQLLVNQRNVYVLYGPKDATQAVTARLNAIGIQKTFTLQGGWEAWTAHQSQK